MHDMISTVAYYNGELGNNTVLLLKICSFGLIYMINANGGVGLKRRYEKVLGLKLGFD